MEPQRIALHRMFIISSLSASRRVAGWIRSPFRLLEHGDKFLSDTLRWIGLGLASIVVLATLFGVLVYLQEPRKRRRTG